MAAVGKIKGKFTITGTLASAPSNSVVLELYSDKTADPSGFGRGETFLQELTVTTDASGNFTAVFSKAPAAKSAISLTARLSNGTSAFSLDATV